MESWKPEGYNSLSPYLICPNAVEDIGFIEQVFDGTLLRRFDRPDGSLMHAEVRIDDTVLMIGGAQTAQQSSGAHIHLYVRDCMAVYGRAIEAGATSIQVPERKRADDDVRGGFRDASGTTWWVATQ